MTFDGEQRQLANDVIQWGMFVLAIVAIFFRNHSYVLEVALGLLTTFVLVSIVAGRRWIRVPRVVHDVRSLLPEDNRKVWGEVRDSYSYFGISGGTMQVPFRAWINRNRFPRTARLRMLFAMPFSDSIRQSKEVELGCAPTEQEVARASEHIEEMALFYSECLSSPSIEVRFYSGYHGYWEHIINGNEVIIGHYLRGKDGLESLALHLKQTPRGNELFQFYKEEYERIWEKAVPVEAYFSNKKNGVPQ